MSGPGAAVAALAGRLGADALERPALLALALALAAAGLLLALRRRPAAIPWPALREACAAGARRRDPGRALGLAGRTAALSLLGVALAGPVSEHRAPPPPGLGLDLVLVVDASDSMRALDAEIDGAFRTRLELARRVVARFARERVAEGDRVGLVVFGETAFTQCPLTTDGRLLEAALERVVAGVAGGATALGDALALAVKRVSLPAETGSARPLAGRLVVLLTDGRSNAGAIPPDVAAALAAARGVRVHTVGIGSSGEVAIEPSEGAGGAVRLERHDLDAETLLRIAGATGGRAFEARSSADLASVYAEIDMLERVPRPAPARPRRTPRPEPWLAAAGALVALELATARGLARRIP
jgi:Ca-activated chloride channel family protein